jgi:hypothetical protein
VSSLPLLTKKALKTLESKVIFIQAKHWDIILNPFSEEICHWNIFIGGNVEFSLGQHHWDLFHLELLINDSLKLHCQVDVLLVGIDRACTSHLVMRRLDRRGESEPTDVLEEVSFMIGHLPEIKVLVEAPGKLSFNSRQHHILPHLPSDLVVI